MATEHDLEKKVSLTSETTSPVPESESGQPSWLRHWSSKLLSYGVEVHGLVLHPALLVSPLTPLPPRNRVSPVRPDDQNYTSLINLFFLWLSANTVIITCESAAIQQWCPIPLTFAFPS